MRRSLRINKRTGQRGGFTVVLVLACCSVAVMLVMLSLQSSLKQRRQLRSELQLEQTRWVLDAAIRKSIADPPDEASEDEVLPKLDKFERVLVDVDPGKANGKIVVRAKISNAAGTSVTARSASFEAAD